MPTSGSFQVSWSLAAGLTFAAAFVGALVGKKHSTAPLSIAMAATSGDRLVGIPGGTSPAHLTGEFPRDRGFDPLGLSKDPTQSLPSKFLIKKFQRQSSDSKNFARMRISEVFHGRLAMLGLVGCVAPELFFQKGAWFSLGFQTATSRVTPRNLIESRISGT